MSRLLILLPLCLALQASAATGRQRINFTSGGQTLAGLLELPARDAPHPVILFATDDGPIPKETFLSATGDDASRSDHHAIGRWDRFTRLGFACFAWDKPGTGESSGEWKPDTSADRAREILAAIKTLRQTPGVDPDRIGLWCNSHAAQALGAVLAGDGKPAFLIALSPPVRTPLDSAADQLRAELSARVADTNRVDRAANLFLRKWEMLRSGIPFAALTKYITEERRTLADADHAWLAPFTPDEFAELTGPRRVELEAWFDAPFTRLLHADFPVLAFFGNDDPAPSSNPSLHPHLNILRFRDADHRAQDASGAVTPTYWRALETFFTARFPEVGGRPATVFKSTTTSIDGITVELNFLDERTIAHELNLTDLAARALRHYAGLFGGPPRDESGAYFDRLLINIDHGDLAAKATSGRVDLTIGPQKAFGYLDWRTTFLHELAHLWIGESFRPADTRVEWFNEGATEYLSLKTAIRLGVLPATDAPDLLPRSWANYLSARGIGEISLMNAGKEGPRARYFLLYHGGLTASMILDYEIRRHTANAKGIDDLFRLLHQPAVTTSTYDADTLLRHLTTLTGQDFTPFFRRHIAGTEIIPVGQYITRLEVEALKSGQIEKLPQPDRDILRTIFEIPPGP
ncbi:MAG: hypothetical protein ISQ14_15205 [Verrucomicrobiae bacterium]|nr:hypothetical protein [Verrucomicrobiae bacterium]